MKWRGSIGYRTFVEDADGVTREKFIERPVKGDATRYYRKYDQTESINTNVSMDIVLSAVLDKDAFENIENIVYVVYGGTRWGVTSIDPTHRPRLELKIGGVWHA